MRRAVFLDRDGVLNAAILDGNGRPRPPASPEEFIIPPCVPGACAKLRAAGFLLVCVTNQPDLARGRAVRTFVDWANREVENACGLQAVLVCPHDDGNNCDCRKPKPGLIHRAARTFGIDLAQSFMIGDRYRDIEAGQAAGLRTVMLDYGYPERPPMQPPDFACKAFDDAAAWILDRAVHSAFAVSEGILQ